MTPNKMHAGMPHPQQQAMSSHQQAHYHAQMSGMQQQQHGQMPSMHMSQAQMQQRIPQHVSAHALRADANRLRVCPAAWTTALTSRPAAAAADAASRHAHATTTAATASHAAHDDRLAAASVTQPRSHQAPLRAVFGLHATLNNNARPLASLPLSVCVRRCFMH